MNRNNDTFKNISLKNRFPFRLGTTSYIIPADILPNIEFLADKIDDIELVLFESNEISNLPGKAVIDKLSKFAEENNITYTIHFPLDIVLGDIDESSRKESVQKCYRIIELMEYVQPFGYLVHCTGHGKYSDTGNSGEIELWKSALDKSLKELCDSDVDTRRFCVETLNYPFELIEDVVYNNDLSVCLDIGHLLLGSYPVDEYMEKYSDRSRVIHLHGIIDGHDHRDISGINTAVLSRLMKRLTENNHCDRVMTLEIFNEKDFWKSLKILEAFAQ